MRVAEKSSPSSESPENALLSRPGRLKSWANDLIGVVRENSDTSFEHWGRWDSRLTRSDLEESLKKICSCASVLELRRGVDRVTGELTSPSLHAGNYCRQPSICPTCAGRLQDTRKKTWRSPIEKAAKQYQHAYLLTATIRPRATWRETLSALRNSLTAFRKKGQRGRKGEWAKVKAAIGKVELKRGTGGNIHVHWHALAFSNEPFDYRIWDRTKKGSRVPLRPYHDPLSENKIVPLSKLTEEWLHSTGDSYNFDVRELKPLEKHLVKGMSAEQSIFEQSREVLKYATKFDSRPEAGQESLFAADFVGIRDATYNRRLFASYGAFYGLGPDDEYKDERYKVGDKPLFYRVGWSTFSKSYGSAEETLTPVFPDYESRPALQKLKVEENRAQGNFRRARARLLEARERVRCGAPLGPVEIEWKIYDGDGNVTIQQQVLEPPAAVVANPKSLVAWEGWLNSLKEAGRLARRNICEEARQALDDVPDLWQFLRDEDKKKRYFVDRSVWFQESVVNSFLEILDPGGGSYVHPGRAT